MAFIIYNFTAGLLIIFSALPNKCGFKSLEVQKTLSKNTLTNFQEKSRLMFGRMNLLFRMNLSLTLVNPSPAKSRKQLGRNVVKGNVQNLVKATISALKSWSVNYQIPDLITTMNTWHTIWLGSYCWKKVTVIFYQLVDYGASENNPFTVAKCWIQCLVIIPGPNVWLEA